MQENTLVFRKEEFIEKYLNKGARLAQRKEFFEKCAELRGRMTTNPLNHVSNSFSTVDQ
jgi:hypothetical protein